MRRAVSVVLLATAVAPWAGCSHPATPRPAATPSVAPAARPAPDEADAVAAAEEWLALVDEGRYGESWDRASSRFRERIGRDAWISLVRGVRAGLGNLRGRTFSTSDYASAESRPVVILVWKSDYEALTQAVEQVTMILDHGSWRCVGYFVRRR